MRYFFSTGEASGELAAVLLAREIRKIDPQAQFKGIGGARMRDEGFRLWRDHRGWATFGPFNAVRVIPKLFVEHIAAALHIKRSKPDLVILIDFGAFNIRLAKLLRRRRYRGPVMDIFPPSAWLDRERAARAVSAVATPVTAFAHQRDFFESLGLPVHYFGHPLAAQYVPRAPLPAPPAHGGTIALLPGSRRAELTFHVPRLIEAFKLLQLQRPQLRGIFGAANATAERTLHGAVRSSGVQGLSIEAGLSAADNADAAFVASGTAVLECALRGIPAVALYVVSQALARYFKSVYKRPYITLPNLVLNRAIVPELLQEAATPQALARAMDELLRDPQRQLHDLQPLREALGPADALERCARFAVELAASG